MRTAPTAEARQQAQCAVTRKMNQDAPILWSYIYQPDDSIVAPAGPAQMLAGRMVADVPGVYTAVATTAGVAAEYSFRVVPRDAIRKLEVVGQGFVSALIHQQREGCRIKAVLAGKIRM